MEEIAIETISTISGFNKIVKYNGVMHLTKHTINLLRSLSQQKKTGACEYRLMYVHNPAFKGIHIDDRTKHWTKESFLSNVVETTLKRHQIVGLYF